MKKIYTENGQVCMISYRIQKYYEGKGLTYILLIYFDQKREKQTRHSFTRLKESIQRFSYLPEDQKCKVILGDGNNAKQCASFLKTILDIRRFVLINK